MCETWSLPWPRLFQAHSEGEPEKKEVSELRSELWEKEMKLTDIRLEALNSAHQLEQLRETMHNMQVGSPACCLATLSTRVPTVLASSPLSCAPGCCWHTAPYPVAYFIVPQLEVDLLKAENDRLKVAPGPSAVPGSVPSHITSTSASSSPRRSLGLTLGHAFSPSLGDAGRGDRAAGRWRRAGIGRSVCGGSVLLLTWSEQRICCAAGAAVIHSRICLQLCIARPGGSAVANTASLLHPQTCPPWMLSALALRRMS